MTLQLPAHPKFPLLALLILSFLFTSTHSYLQFTLFKNSQPKNQPSNQPQDDCITKNTFKSLSPSQQQGLQYDELCYFKDIAYYIQLFHDNQLHHISVDLTSPFSWLKSQHCTLVDSGDSCRLIQQAQHKKPKKKKNTLHKTTDDDSTPSASTQQSTPKHDDSTTSNQHSNKLARIQGSNQLVEGYLQQNKAIEFWTKDSGRLSRLVDILMLGFYMVQEKQKVALQKTNFINTTRLSENMDRLCDGALSLRFDDSSQNSFLQQIFEYTQTVEKMITIYVNGQESTLTIGELSIKNTAEGYSGIVWVPFDNSEDNTAYGRLPLVQSILLESLAKDKEQDIEKDEDNSIFVVFSLSASYIGLPEIAINELAKQFKNKYGLECSVSKHSYFECNSTHSKESTLTENILFVMKEGAISLPIESLILKQSKKKLTLNLRLISKQENEKEKFFIILGEPYFNKYFTALDYRNNKVGFALKRSAQHDNFISTVSLIRFVSFLFFTGCCFLICFQPLKKMLQAFTGNKEFYNRKSPEGRRLKYEPIEQNPYEEVAGTLRTVMQQSEES